ncbi:hypothetical protein [Streptomyces sp. NPDC090112]|uniref:hypothetical protein n=1 Tax=Streptomyces sp. NPDC090112 TaxID=3365949 RepID=UPI0037F4C8AA
MDLTAARAYARRNPGNAVHARLLASLDPDWRPPAPLNLAPIRAEQAAARERAEADRRARTRAEAEAARTRPLNVGAVRKDRAAVMVAQSAPVAPPGATRAVGPDGRWRWAYVDPQLVGGHRWASLALGLTTAGPLVSLEVRRGDCGTDRGRTEIRRGADGLLWAVITVSPDAGPTPAATLRHEFAHVADELVRLRAAGSVEAWHASFRHHTPDAEHFAEGAEVWLEPEMRAADLLARATAHQDYRARARGR